MTDYIVTLKDFGLLSEDQWLAVHLNRPVKGQRLDNLPFFSVPWRFCNCYGFFLVFEILNFQTFSQSR